MELKDLEIYRVSRKIAALAWPHYDAMTVSVKRTMGDQWIRATDSVGANIAEGYGRFHYADRNKFNFNARGSLTEARHWTDLLQERGILNREQYGELIGLFDELGRGLNAYITATRSLSMR